MPSRILIADDEPLILNAILRNFRRDTEFEFVTAADGIEAARKVHFAQLALDDGIPFLGIICDVCMPRQTGPQFFQWLERNYPDTTKNFVFHTNDPELVKNHKAPVVSKCDFASLKSILSSWSLK